VASGRLLALEQWVVAIEAASDLTASSPRPCRGHRRDLRPIKAEIRQLRDDITELRSYKMLDSSYQKLTNAERIDELRRKVVNLQETQVRFGGIWRDGETYIKNTLALQNGAFG
jgi:hypothetical protein